MVYTINVAGYTQIDGERERNKGHSLLYLFPFCVFFHNFSKAILKFKASFDVTSEGDAVVRVQDRKIPASTLYNGDAGLPWYHRDASGFTICTSRK